MKLANENVDPKKSPLKILSAMILVGFCFGASVANAAKCTAVSNGTDPDATVTNSESCGEGTSGQGMDNDTAALVNIAEPSSLDWGLAGKYDNGWSGVSGTSLDVDGTQGGTWAITTDLDPDDYAFLLVIKDGNDVDPAWFWFIIDESFGDAEGFGSPVDFSGDWTMYGKNGTLKNISHMSLYVASTDPENPEPPFNIPEAGSLALLGSALAGLWATGRKRQQKQS